MGDQLQSMPTSQQTEDEASPELSSQAIARDILQQGRRPDELARRAAAEDPWLWRGILACGKITRTASQWKSGKTRLISVLLARMADGGKLADLTVRPGRAAVISEEDPEDWDTRCQKLQIGGNVVLFCRPFAAKPSMAQWHGLIQAMLDPEMLVSFGKRSRKSNSWDLL